MRTVSDNWKKNQIQNLVGKSDIRIVLDVTDPEAVSDASATSNNSTYFSKVAQIVNDKDKTVQNYATLEQNFWCLDGSNRILPVYHVLFPFLNVGDVGYVSGILSDEDCRFSTNPKITLSFSRVFTTTLPAITIKWNRLSMEYAIEFQVIVYNDDEIILSELITDNNSVESIIYRDISNYNKIEIEVIKWCKPYSRVRITDIDLGISKEFLKENIISMSVREENDPIVASLPINCLKFELDNSDDFFNPYNIDGFYKYLCRRQKIIAKVGYNNSEEDAMEWLKIGEYYLSEWNSPQNSITASFEANNLLSFLNNKRYIECKNTPSGTTLYSLAFSLLNNAGLRKNSDGTNKWIIDDVLKNYSTKGIIPTCTQLEALQYIAQAACCVLFCDNDGNIHIEPINDVETDYEVNMFNSYKFPEIDVQKVLGRVHVNCYTYTSTSDYSELFNGILEIEGDEEITIEFSSPTLEISSLVFNVEGATSFVPISYNNGCKLSLKGCSGEVTIVIMGKTVDTSSRIITIINDENSDDEQDISNPLVTSFAQAKEVGEWVKRWLNNRNQISTEWRCDPRLNAMDKIQVVNKFGETDVSRVTSLEIRYNGGFKGKLEGRLT